MFGFYKVYHVTVRTWRNKFHRVSLRYSIIQPTCNSKRQSKQLQRSKKYLKEISDTQFRYCQSCLHIKCKKYICQIDRYRIQINDQKRTRVQTAIIIWSIAKNVFLVQSKLFVNTIIACDETQVYNVLFQISKNELKTKND